MTIALGILAALLTLYAGYLRRQRNGWRNNATRTHDINRQLSGQLDMYTACFATAVEQTLHLDGRGRHD